jgi:phospholipid transport system substrate-binding protein
MRSVGRRAFGIVLVILAMGLGAARASAQEEPVKVIQSFYDVLLDVMKNADKLGVHGREQKLDPVIRKTYDLPLMARLTVGPQWQSLTPEQQQRITEAFSKMTVATYANRFDGYSGEKLEVSPQPQKSNNGTIVQTKLVKSDGEPITLNYLMREGEGTWKVIDVFLNGTASELATRRAEFSSVLRRDGADALVKLIEKRAAEGKG